MIFKKFDGQFFYTKIRKIRESKKPCVDCNLRNNCISASKEREITEKELKIKCGYNFCFRRIKNPYKRF